MAMPRYAKPEILASIPVDDHAVIEASAGTGKTFTLEHLIIDLLLRGTPIEQILVVTFTEKATAELRMRVRRKIDELALLGEGGEELDPDRSWLIDARARGLLLRALSSFDSATIATIHGFCQRVLTENAFASGRLFAQEQVDGRHAFSRAFKDALREHFARDPDAQRDLRAALENGWSVETLEHELYACSRSPGPITPAYDPVVLERVLGDAPLAAMTGPEIAGALKALKVNAATVKSVLKKLADLAALIAPHLVERDDLAFSLDLQRFCEENPKEPHLLYLCNRFEGLALQGDAARVAGWVRELCSVAAAPLGVLASKMLPPVLARLRRRKREAGLFDFDDMLSMVRDALCGPQGGALVDALRGRYRFALIDEFQDTDEVQWQIFEKIFFESARRNVLFLIGDPKQAIYGFRGADVHTYVRATGQIVAAGGARVSLDRNYRSTPALIEACNLIFDQRGDPPFFGGTAIRYERPAVVGDPTLGAFDGDGAPAVPVCLMPVEGARGARKQLAALGARVAEEIRALLHPETPSLLVARGGASRVLRARDVFVLTRTAPEGRVVGACLRAAGVPCTYVKQQDVFQSDEAGHVLALLDALAEPHETGKKMRAWLTPFFGVPLERADRCLELAAEHPLNARLFELSALANDRRYEELFGRIMATTGVVRRELMLHDGERALTNYQHLFELLLEEVARSRCTTRELAMVLRSFIDERRKLPGADAHAQRLESERDAVQVMSMHQSKGLEAAVVFVLGEFSAHADKDVVRGFHEGERRYGSAGRHLRTRQVREALEREAREESERLFYVALTRARARLYLPYFAERDGKSTLLASARYGKVNDRLVALARRGFAGSFAVLPAASPDVDPRAAAATEASLALWQPPDELLEPPGHRGGAWSEAELRDERAARRGPFLTSYTAMQRGYEPEPVRAEGEGDAEGALSVASPVSLASPFAPPPRGPDDLPGGAASGIFLHDVIESLPFGTLDDAPGVEAWRQRHDVERVLERLARLHDIDPRFLPHAATLVHAALTRPVDLGRAGSLAGLFSASKRLCEVEFLFPLPRPDAERGAPLVEVDDGGPGRAPRRQQGYVKGFIDFLFEHHGLCFFADWKSDALASWSPHHVAAHVADHYPRQMQLYSLALCRSLGVRTERDYEARFGGMLYCFLRGMVLGDGVGVFFDRPAWSQIVAWEAELATYQRAS